MRNLDGDNFRRKEVLRLSSSGGSYEHRSTARTNLGIPCLLLIDDLEYARVHPHPESQEVAREIVRKISDAAIELAFVRHSLTTTDYEETEYVDVEEGVEAFKELVKGVKADVFAILTGDDTGCLDPEDVDYDNEMEWTRRRIASASKPTRHRLSRSKLSGEEMAFLKSFTWQRASS